MAKTNEIDSSSINILGAGTAVKGDITANGDFRIDGSLIGNISAKGKLVIGATGFVEGEITCQNADFSGNIKGKVNVAELLSLKSTSKVTGDIIINKLSIEPVLNSRDLVIWIVEIILHNTLPKVKLKNPKKSLNDYAKYSSISFQMVAIILIGVFAGVKLDEWMKNGTPVFTLIFTILAVVLAIYYVIKDLIGK